MRFLFRTVLVLALVAIGTYLLGYWSLDQVTGNAWRVTSTPASGAPGASTGRDRIAQVDAQAGKAAHTVSEFLSDAELTGKIRSKMALDDRVRARTIGVSTTDGVVTLEGTIGSAAEHDQAVRLARDTKGVKQVVDHLKVVLP
ncbi:MAG: BON domain-containing protein [Planctomycetota bacterium]|nr:MAG: BON domain-containing protein [Planctomycetota bacterium]